MKLCLEKHVAVHLFLPPPPPYNVGNTRRFDNWQANKVTKTCSGYNNNDNIHTSWLTFHWANVMSSVVDSCREIRIILLQMTRLWNPRPPNRCDWQLPDSAHFSADEIQSIQWLRTDVIDSCPTPPTFQRMTTVAENRDDRQLPGSTHFAVDNLKWT